MLKILATPKLILCFPRKGVRKNLVINSVATKKKLTVAQVSDSLKRDLLKKCEHNA